MAAPPLLYLQDIHLSLGNLQLLGGAELSVGAGERLALVGRNGSGKSTLLKIAAGMIKADRGSRIIKPGVTVRYLPQEPDLSAFDTTFAYLESQLGPGDDPYRGIALLNQLGLSGEENPAHLSGGEVRRCALAAMLAPNPDILLLDEPTNHLDLPAIAWLESELASMRSALVLISHDRRFLEALSKAMVWLDRGTARRVERGFGEFEAWRDEILEQEERDAHKLTRQIAREEDWLRYGVTARRKRNVRRVGELQALREKRRTRSIPTGQVNMAASEGAVSGALVIAADGIGKKFGDAPAVVKDFSTRIMRGDRIGIIGPNGAGKTTLLNMLTGALEPDQGKVTLGSNLTMVTLDQRRESLDPNLTLAQTLTEGRGDMVYVGGEARHVLGYMKDFLFTADHARTPVSVLSGGERGRLLLARALAIQSNLLVLDEPTNDIDLETLDLLQEVLAEYQGTVVVISHDRDFLDRVATSVIVAEGDGSWQEYAGGYSDMLTQRGKGITAKNLFSAVKPVKGEKITATAPVRIKMNNKQQQALRTLPSKIEALNDQIAKLNQALSQSTGDRAKDEQRARDLTTAMAALASAEDEWLELSLLAEQAG